MPHTEYDKEKAEDYMLGNQPLHALRLPLGKDTNVHEGATTPVSEGGTTSPLCGTLINVRPFPTTDCAHSVGRGLDQQELPSLIDVVLTSKGGGEILRSLSADDAQMLIDYIDQVHSTATCHHTPAY